MKRIPLLALLVCSMACLQSCTQASKFEFSDPVIEEVCGLQENIGLIGEVSSLSFFDDSTFAVSSGSNSPVYVYSVTGEQIRQIGHAGRAEFEYLDPRISCSEDGITVWSASLMKFINFTADGEPLSECHYPSAIYDFEVAGDKIIVYTSGTRCSHVLDVLDSATGVIVDSLLNASPSHIALNALRGNAPLCLSSGSVFFTPKDELTVYEWEGVESKLKVVAQTDSPTFIVEHLNDRIGDVMKLLAFPDVNSSVQLLLKRDDGTVVLTLEGSLPDNSYYSVYKINNHGKVAVTHYKSESLTVPGRFYAHDGEIYFIKGHDGMPVLYHLVIS